MITEANVLNYLIANRDRLLHDYHLTKIGVFGSIARGEQDENSDIDLLVEFEANTSDLYALKTKLRNEIQARFNRSVDICRLKYIKPFFLEQILAEIKYV